MVKFQCCSETVRPQLLLQEYVPVRLEWPRSREIVRYLEYSNGSKSLLEIVTGIETGKIHRLTLPICFDYTYGKPLEMVCDEEIKNMELKAVTDKERETMKCDLCLFIHDREVNIIFKKSLKICQYIKNGRIQIGLNDNGGLEKIDIMDLSDEEIKHIKQELELQ